MKKSTFYIITIGLMLTLQPIQLRASTNASPPPVTDTKPPVPKEARVLLLRLNEIDEMDKTDLNASEKKELRKEVRTIKSELRSSGNGLYLSAGAVVIIVILLIILL